MFKFLTKSRNKTAEKGPSKEAPVPSLNMAETGTFHIAPNYSVAVATVSDVGCHREINEDRVTSVEPAAEMLQSRGRLVVVADGMGGHSAGEVASTMAVETIRRSYYEGDDEAYAALKRAFAEANKSIYDESKKDESLNGMGTTCTALVLRNGSAISAHVGDSRLYLIRDGGIYLMTEDHSAVMELVKLGVLTLEGARHHPDKNVILKALGSHPEVEPTIWREPFPVKEGDRFLLCSDGLYDLVEDDEIKQAVLATNVHEACEKLVALAKERGGFDNITIAIVGIDPAGTESAEAKVTRQLEVSQ